MSAPNLTFSGHDDQPLDAVIDWPAEPLRGFALFAHCFTCGKDLFAARQIARALAGKGIACVRFDFSGVGRGASQPELAGFTHDLDDLVAVYEQMRERFQAPALLVGHSLGGAAVLAAAHRMPDVSAVVTVGAPFDPGHVSHLIPHAARDEISERGFSEVSLGGRQIKVRDGFLESISNHDAEVNIGRLRKALLVMHAPNDEIVEIDNAARIYAAAKHPKSFVSLDSADHLLSRRNDALYAAEVIAAWSSRYLPAAEAVDAPADRVVVRETNAGIYQQLIHAEGHRLIADEPESVGGDNTGASPYGLLGAALGACTSMTLRMYAERKKIALDHVEVTVRHQKIHAADCERCDSHTGKVDEFVREIRLTGNLTDEQRQSLLKIADRCPVHQTLERSNQIVTALSV
ncbi:alpha/beta fold hydrolase [Litorivicinus lipolyticus]|uniref:bifunctional alpha/beta hydrolase/OsmC family protein n=1 Tax=Litorivicinus lipolyticus TaxID=418701 RepID=UPI003B5AA1F4